MEKWLIYSKDQCPYCEKAKFRLKDRDVEVRNISENIDFFEELRTKNPAARTMPQIYLNDQLIGGYDQLEQFLNVRELGLGE